MNTPPTGIQGVPSMTDITAKFLAQDLSKRLEEVINSREKATPEPVFQDDDVEQCYQWICEELRRHFTPDEAEKHRMAIPHREYWELEARVYGEAVEELMWKKACVAHGVGRGPSADGWRTLAVFYQGLLRENGLSPQQISEIRQSIDNQKYWQAEAELYRQRAALQEWKMQEDLLEADALRQSITQRQTRGRRPAYEALYERTSSRRALAILCPGSVSLRPAVHSTVICARSLLSVLSYLGAFDLAWTS
ncbi:hypothetical protein F5X99DRAFT_393756 [Biscogniauxia marginata]|nr:hypothetical protein F5X99DRAFT_393756 [Biscogniauxia marginata]